MNLPHPARIRSFQRTVLDYYAEHGRDLPWRRTRDPYAILVSEFMLQQTQVARVITRYGRFLDAFPNVRSLAGAALTDVLAEWQGLGYNRRALALHRAAHRIVIDHGGVIPSSPSALRELPGVGASTAGAVCAFAYDCAQPFVETNIRSAVIHHFFAGAEDIPDTAILGVVEATLDRDDPRTWYYAMMDYGSWVKQNHQDPAIRSRHHTIQAPFAGSHRQLRAEVLRVVLCASPATMTPSEVHRFCSTSDKDLGEIRTVLEELLDDGFLSRQADRYRIA